jgi:uncharacterized protein YcbX
MGDQLVGHVAALWRYPVKSMLGEQVPRLEVESTGVCGDRGYALWDHASSRVASAKNPSLWSALLAYRATYVREPEPGCPLPPVTIEGPAPTSADAPGARASSADADLNARLSQQLGRRVSLLDRPPPGASLDQYWPPVEGRAYQDVTNELVLPAGSFFDACSIHAISTASLERLRQLQPGSDFAVERFRPNLLIAPCGDSEGFVEEGWVGGCLQIGDQLELLVEGGCPRCVITTLAQGSLPNDIEILRTTARHNHVVAGIRLSVRRSGAIAVGDPVRLIPLPPGGEPAGCHGA